MTCACGNPIKFANDSRCEDCYAIGMQETTIQQATSLREKKAMNRFQVPACGSHGGALRLFKRQRRDK